ncbi:MAG: L-fucose:H+ symporter permease [Blastochloris sp.]|nr:L-fucose:H+ symporter permease [Blastochloris sp.]
MTKPPLLPRHLLPAFALVTFLFALWGFANDITNPMVAAFKNILLLSHFQSSLVQFAFYGGYCIMAIPAALFIKRYNYKSGILIGLGLYTIGCFLFIPAGNFQAFSAFLAAYFIMTCGLSFLETSANPYILSMGDEQRATQRLNLAQAFNPMGSLLGMFTAKIFILDQLHPASETERTFLQTNDPSAFQAIQAQDLDTLGTPYILLGAVVLAAFLLFLVCRLPGSGEPQGKPLDLRATLTRLRRNPRYVEGVVAQVFYVGAQIMCWTFIIQYGVHELNLSPSQAQGYNIIAMLVFVSSRLICTFLLKYLHPARLLWQLALAACLLTLGTILIQGLPGLYCLVGISACMSLMFPTIYGIALHQLGDDAKLASAGLILAIGGGCLMPPLQGAIMDLDLSLALSSTRLSFFLPFLCFVVIAFYGLRSSPSPSEVKN